MNFDPADPRQRVPVLTDVIDASELASLAPVAASVALPALPAPPVAVPPAPAGVPSVDMAQVLARLELAVQAKLEARLEAVIEPLVARWSERLLNDAKASVVAAAREVVQDAVAEEMSRHPAG